jgi:ABC-2 type transport system permease protein
MKYSNAIFIKELRSIFNSPLAYLFITVFLGLSSWLFFSNFFLNGQASMRAFFDILPWLLLVLLPAISMRLFSEEQKLGTLELLMTAPVKEHSLVFGKFAASFAVFGITLMLSLTLPILVSIVGDPDFGPIFAGYLGTALLGGAFLSLGLWVSSWTDNSILSFLASGSLLFILFIMGHPMVLESAPLALLPAFRYFSFFTHYSSISRGVLDSRDVLYFILFISFFLYLTTASLVRRRTR